MTSFKVIPSTKKREGEYKSITLRACVTPSVRPVIKTSIEIMEDWLKGNCIEVPRLGKYNAKEVYNAKVAKGELETLKTKVEAICNVYQRKGKEELLKEKGFINEVLVLIDDVKPSSITYEAIQEAIERNKEEAEGFIKRKDFFGLFGEYADKEDFSIDHRKHLYVLQRVLARYQMFRRATGSKSFVLDIETLDKETCLDFFDYMKNEKSLSEEYPRIFAVILKEYPSIVGNVKRNITKIEDRGCNTIKKSQKYLKHFFGWINKEGITNNNPMQGITIGAELTSETPIYFSIKELRTIANWDFSNNLHLDRQRDVFVFQCCIGCRVGDLYELTRESVKEGYVQYIPHKTIEKHAKVASVPLNTLAMAILEKYKDLPSLLPLISTQKYNEAIKEIVKECGIDRIVTKLNTITKREEQHPIYEVVSSHTARRTFCGIMYKQVKDPNIIGEMSGHAPNSKAFLRYRAIDMKDKEEAVKGAFGEIF